MKKILRLGAATLLISFMGVGVASAASATLPVTTLYLGLAPDNTMAPEPVAVVPSDVAFSFTDNMPAAPGSVFDWMFDDTQGNSVPGIIRAGGGGNYNGVNYGLTNINPYREGMQYFTIDGIPVFGRSDQTEEFWMRYTFGEDWESYAPEFNKSELVEYGDFFFPMDGATLVIKGVWANAIGKISQDAVFTASIYRLAANYQIPESPNFQAFCRGDEVTVNEEAGQDGYDLLSLYFAFDPPVEVTKKNYPFYLVSIGGFNDPENVEYFNPEMSAVNSPTRMGLGWTGHRLMFDGQEREELSWSSVTNLTDDKLYSFYIMLDAEYPMPGTTGIVFTEESVTDRDGMHGVETGIYSLDGRKLSSDNLRPGIYVKDGRKVVIK